MKKIVILANIFLFSLINTAYAGSLVNGEWSVTSCGEKPKTPVVDGTDTDTYNKTIKAINEWQQVANTYYGCIIKEANADNKVISTKAKSEQGNYKQDFENIQAELETAKKKLEK